MRSFSRQASCWNRGAICLLLSFVCLAARASEPPAVDEHSTGPSQQQAAASEEPTDTEPEAQAKIRRALQGDPAGNGQQASGDPLLDDVLQMIRRRGSLLDGTALDPKRDESKEPTAPKQPTQFSEPAPAFRAAESLLRSARLLESLPHSNTDRRQLIHRLRREASRCLQEALSAAPAAAPETQ